MYYYRFTPKTTQWVLFEFVSKKSPSAWDLGHFKLKIRIILTWVVFDISYFGILLNRVFFYFGILWYNPISIERGLKTNFSPFANYNSLRNLGTHPNPIKSIKKFTFLHQNHIQKKNRYQNLPYHTQLLISCLFLNLKKNSSLFNQVFYQTFSFKWVNHKKYNEQIVNWSNSKNQLNNFFLNFSTHKIKIIIIFFVIFHRYCGGGLVRKLRKILLIFGKFCSKFLIFRIFQKYEKLEKNRYRIFESIQIARKIVEMKIDFYREIQSSDFEWKLIIYSNSMAIKYQVNFVGNSIKISIKIHI